MTWLGAVALMLGSALVGFVFGAWLTIARRDDRGTQPKDDSFYPNDMFFYKK